MSSRMRSPTRARLLREVDGASRRDAHRAVSQQLDELECQLGLMPRTRTNSATQRSIRA
jgi:hypothetical protein